MSYEPGCLTKFSVLQAQLWDHLILWTILGFLLSGMHGDWQAFLCAEMTSISSKKFWPWIRNCDILYILYQGRKLKKKKKFFSYFSFSERHSRCSWLLDILSWTWWVSPQSSVDQPEHKIWGVPVHVFCEFELRFIVCLSHCSAVCNDMMLYVLEWHPTVYPFKTTMSITCMLHC